MVYFSQPKRCELLGNYIVEQGATVRETARYFGVSKSTVHKDVTQELQWVNRRLYEQVCIVLQKNKDERHLRGGEATRRKYHSQKEQSGENHFLFTKNT
ncbi:MAG: stage III sporulation protein D [Ruminococcaceae bacterium]|nr:stage III sporulation protein D [Oscillospiraceae bacterium]